MNYLREANVARATEDFKTYQNAGVLYFTTALAGEVGELCNLIKKMERAKVGGPDIGYWDRDPATKRGERWTASESNHDRHIGCRFQVRQRPDRASPRRLRGEDEGVKPYGRGARLLRSQARVRLKDGEG